MKVYSQKIIFIGMYTQTSIYVGTELKRNILRFGKWRLLILLFIICIIANIGAYQKNYCTLCINSIMYLNTLKVKYIQLYEQLLHRFECMLMQLEILLKGYLQIPLLPPC